MQHFHNIEKSAFRKGEYVGYASGLVFRINKNHHGLWQAHNQKHGWLSVPAPTLRDISLRLENLILA